MLESTCDDVTPHSVTPSLEDSSYGIYLQMTGQRTFRGLTPVASRVIWSRPSRMILTRDGPVIIKSDDVKKIN